jgi:hypothetical protein
MTYRIAVDLYRQYFIGLYESNNTALFALLLFVLNRAYVYIYVTSAHNQQQEFYLSAFLILKNKSRLMRSPCSRRVCVSPPPKQLLNA